MPLLYVMQVTYSMPRVGWDVWIRVWIKGVRHTDWARHKSRRMRGCGLQVQLLRGRKG